MADENKTPKVKLPTTCGHKNAHFISAVDPVTGKVLNEGDMTCVLDKGHDGDHQADYLTLSGGLVLKKRAFWNDNAGTAPGA